MDILFEEGEERKQPPRRQVSLWGISYTMDVDPERLTGSYFPCPQCRSNVYDGGIPKVCKCRCGRSFVRKENLAVTECEEVKVDSFFDLFRVCVQTPPAGSIPSLVSVTFGLFETGNSDPDTALRTKLLPFTLFRERCYGLNDLIEVNGLQFKVLAAEPAYGIARRHTKIQCYTVLHTGPILSLKVASIYPLPLTHDHINRLISPYIQTQFTHLHLSNAYRRSVYLYSRGTVCGGRTGTEVGVLDAGDKD